MVWRQDHTAGIFVNELDFGSASEYLHGPGLQAGHHPDTNMRSKHTGQVEIESMPLPTIGRDSMVIHRAWGRSVGKKQERKECFQKIPKAVPQNNTISTKVANTAFSRISIVL